MHCIGESRWRLLELCYWPEQGALPAKGKEYPGLGYKRPQDKPPKAQQQQQQPAGAHYVMGAMAAQIVTFKSVHFLLMRASPRETAATDVAQEHLHKAGRMTRKALRSGTKDNEPDTVNPRVWKMFKERPSPPFEKELAELEAGTLECFEGILPLLRAPLPRVWETVEGGLAEPIRATVSHNHPNITGGIMNDSAIRASLAEFEARLQLKVRRPLAQWVEALETVRTRFPELERLRTRLEQRTQKVLAEEVKSEKAARKRAGVKRGARGPAVRGTRVGQRGGGLQGLLFRCTHPLADDDRHSTYEGPGVSGEEQYSGGGGRGGAGSREVYNDEDVDDEVVHHEFKREERGMKLKERQRKLGAARDGFSTEEALLYEQLSGLCRDAAWTKSYVASSLLMTKELIQVANPGGMHCMQAWCKHALVAGGVEVPPATTGQLGSNYIYNAMMPEVTAPTPTTPPPPLPPPYPITRYPHVGYDFGGLVCEPEAGPGPPWTTCVPPPAAACTAHKATAQPLELHATPEARAGERVTMARRGATDVPLAGVPDEALRSSSMAAVGAEVEVVHEATGQIYYWNQRTGQTTALGEPGPHEWKRGGSGGSAGGAADAESQHVDPRAETPLPDKTGEYAAIGVVAGIFLGWASQFI
ncbi:hypothetical protein QJQ45_019897 [Haematococcus lacustris]|nr:hypothetical protein QJQ45_019897 [Haematococcus lacustris]